MTALFISWTSQNGRTEDLARALGIRPIFISSRGCAILRYFRNACATVRVVRSARPAVVVMMLPPTPLLLVVALLSRLYRITPFADLHTGFFLDPKWRFATQFSLFLMKDWRVIVTNQTLASVCARRGVRALVLHDPPVESGKDLAAQPGTGDQKLEVFCPVSYANDEPISELLEAARLTPDMNFVLTGSAPDAVVEMAPDNVMFSGWLSSEEYWSRLRKSDGVMVLTTRAHTMQRGGYEAIAAGKPVITSDFMELRDFFAGAGLYCVPRAEAIADACSEFMRLRHSLAAAVPAVHERWATDARSTIELLREELRGAGARG